LEVLSAYHGPKSRLIVRNPLTDAEVTDFDPPPLLAWGFLDDKDILYNSSSENANNQVFSLFGKLEFMRRDQETDLRLQIAMSKTFGVHDLQTFKQVGCNLYGIIFCDAVCDVLV
jgi:hypothetical protein